MKAPSLLLEQYFPATPKLMVMLLTLAGGSVGLGVLATYSPFLALASVLALIPGIAILLWPEASTLLVIFIIYSNVAAVAVHFHNVPFIAGAVLPMVLLLIPLTHHLILQRRDLILYPVVPLLLLFLVVQTFGTVFSTRPLVALTSLISYLVEGVGLFFLFTNLVRTPEQLRRAIWVLLLVGGILGGLSLYQQMTGDFDENLGGLAQVSAATFETGEERLQGKVEQPRLAGPIGEQNRYAQIMLMLVPLGLFRIWSERALWLQLAASTLTVLIALGVALTFSRGAIIGFVLMVLIVVILGYIKPVQLVVMVMGVAVALYAIPQLQARLFGLSHLVEVFVSEDEGTISEVDGSTKSRLTEIGAALYAFADHPFIGVGPGMFKYHYLDYAHEIGLKVHQSNRQAHSLLPSIAADTGALGLGCFLGVLFITMRDLIRARKRWLVIQPELANTATAFFLAVIGYLTTGLFLHWAFIRFFWLILALAAVASYISAPNDSSPVLGRRQNQD